MTINPASAVISQGNTIQLQFLSGFSDGSTQDMTNVVNWMSSNTSLATVDAQGLVTATSAGANIGPPQHHGRFWQLLGCRPRSTLPIFPALRSSWPAVSPTSSPFLSP